MAFDPVSIVVIFCPTELLEANVHTVAFWETCVTDVYHNPQTLDSNLLPVNFKPSHAPEQLPSRDEHRALHTTGLLLRDLIEVTKLGKPYELLYMPIMVT